jgi:Ca-activated chloride channel family protein
MPPGAFLQPNTHAPDQLWQDATAPEPTLSLEDAIPPGERAAFIDINARGAFGGQIRRRDRIDIMLTTELVPNDDTSEAGVDEAPSQPQTEFVSMTLLQNVTVFEAEASARQDGMWVLTLAVTSDEMRLLEASQAIGEFAILLRHRDDVEIAPIRRHLLHDLLDDLEVIHHAREVRQRKRPQTHNPPSRGPLSSRISADMRALSFPMDLSAPVARHLRPGAHIDVSAVFELSDVDRSAPKSRKGNLQDEFVSIALMQHVKVLETTVGEEKAEKVDVDAPGRLTSPVVVVEVTVDEAKLLALASRRGELKVGLRAGKDDRFTSLRNKSTRQVLEDLEIINRSRQVRMRRPSKRTSQIKIYRGDGSGSHASAKAKSRPSPRTGNRPSSGATKPLVIQRGGRPSGSQPAGNGEAGTREANRTAAIEAAARVHSTKDAPRSTFALDVDTSSYTHVRRHLNEDKLPAKELVRVEEFINYFDYENPWPTTKPFAVTVEGAPSPFRRSERHKLVRIGVQSKRAMPGSRKPVNLTFLVDTSGSMQGDDRLGLVKKALGEVTENLGPRDSIAIVGYSDRVDEILGRTSVTDKPAILEAIQKIRAYGTTNMEAGMARAYQLAHERSEAGAENRVIVLSDGAPNVGASTHEELLETVSAEREKGITLSTIGFGAGNYRDELMEQLADNGDGNSYYVDDAAETERLFGERLLSTLITVARDVKAQVEFDPDVVDSYRRIGYANRALSEQDWSDPSVDAGEIGAGHRITVLYEVKLVEEKVTESLGTVRVRYKLPQGRESFEIAASLAPESMHDNFGDASNDLRFAASVVGFAEVLGQAPLGQYLSLAQIRQTAKKAAGGDPARLEFAELVERAHKLRQAERAEAKRVGSNR